MMLHMMNYRVQYRLLLDRSITYCASRVPSHVGPLQSLRDGRVLV